MLVNPPAPTVTTLPQRPARSRAALPLTLGLFFGSGCAALIDEIVWFQLLQYVVGVSAISLAVLLGAFMGGMCLGSILAPRLVAAGRNPLQAYGLLELGIGLSALALLGGMPYLGACYVNLATQGAADIALRATLCALCLMLPAALMGATLPVAARFVASTPRGVAWLGLFYGANTLGAVVGCLAAGFYLLRVYDLTIAALVAVAINGAVGLAALALGRASANHGAVDAPGEGDAIAAEAPASPGTAADVAAPASRQAAACARDTWPIWLAVALSGLSALGAEVVWTRLLSLLLAGTTYTFSLILAVFLAGLGCGSAVAALLTRGARSALAVCQWLLVPAIGWAAWSLGEGCYVLPLDPGALDDLWTTAARDLARCAWAILPAALLWGASFPLALAALASRAGDRGRLVGAVYAVNTLGAIVGAVAFSLWVIPALGTQRAQQALMMLAGAAALGLAAPGAFRLAFLRPGAIARDPSSAHPGTPSRARRWAPLAALAGAVLATVALVERVRPIPFELIAYGRDAYRFMNRGLEELYRGEGLNSTVGVSRGDGIVQFHVAGKVEASTELSDMRIERMLANLPAMLHPGPRKVLVVGCGAGVTAGAFLPYYQRLERVEICELEPLVPQRVAPFFKDANLDALNDPLVHVTYDDARHYLLTSREKFDIITSDPIHPFVKGAASLYTEEYFRLVRDHLAPGGLVTQWVPLYDSSPETVKIELATFFRVFPEATAWCNTRAQGEGNDMVLLGSAEPLAVDIDELHARMSDRDYRVARGFLRQVGWHSERELLATYVGDRDDLAPWFAGAPINTDGNLRLQFVAGRIPKFNLMGQIYQELIARRTLPPRMFTGSDASRSVLSQAIEMGP